MNLPRSYYNSKSSAAALLLLISISLTGSGFMLYVLLHLKELHRYWLTWLFAAIFGLFLIFSLLLLAKLISRLVSTTPRLMLTWSGIKDFEAGIGEIAWADIESAYMRSTKGGVLICLDLRKEAEYVARLSPITRLLVQVNRPLGFTPIAISLQGVAANPQEVIIAIKALMA